MAGIVVLIVENVSPSLRGEFSRTLIEPKSGVFVGKISALVRDKLWDKACKNVKTGGCTLIYATNNEQGYDIKNYGDTSRKVVDLDGLKLIKQIKP